MRVFRLAWPLEICADSRPATSRPVPTIVPMIAFVSPLTPVYHRPRSGAG